MKKYALVVGVESYRDPQIASLKLAGADAKDLGERLLTDCRFDRVCALASDQGDTEPTVANVIRVLRDFGSELTSEDLFLFFFAGHGIEQDGRGYLLTRETDQAFPEHTSLALELLKKNFVKLSAGKRIILLDSCRNDPDAGRSSGANFMGEAIFRDILATARLRPTDSSTTALLSACGAGQRAYEWTAKGHGVFTYYLLEGMESAAWKHGVLDFDELAHYTAQQVRDWSQRTPGVKHRQEPWYEKSGGPQPIYLAGDDPQAGDYAIPEDASAEFRLAVELRNEGKLKEAIEAIKDGLEKEPNSYELRRLRRDIEAEISAIDNERLQSQQKLLKQRVRKLIRDAKRFEDEGDITSAIACYEECVKIDPYGEGAVKLAQLSARRLIDKGAVTEKLSSLFSEAEPLEDTRPLDAAAFYEEALRIYPKNRRAEDGLARCRRNHEVQSLAHRLNKEQERAASQLKESKAIVAQLQKERAQYVALTMDNEANKTEDEVHWNEVDLERRRRLLNHWERALELLRSSTSVRVLQEKARSDEKLLHQASQYYFTQSGVDRDLLREVFPGLAEADLAFREWQDSLNDAVRQWDSSLITNIVRGATLELADDERFLSIPIPPAICLDLMGFLFFDMIPDTAPEGIDLTQVKERLRREYSSQTWSSEFATCEYPVEAGVGTGSAEVTMGPRKRYRPSLILALIILTIVAISYVSKGVERYRNERSTYREAVQRNDPQSYLSVYPEGRYAIEMRASLDFLEQDQYRKIMKKPDLDAIGRFLERFPGSKLVMVLMPIKDSLTELQTWKAALQANTVKSYKDYIDRYPMGRHVEQAHNRYSALYMSSF